MGVDPLPNLTLSTPLGEPACVKCPVSEPDAFTFMG